jgi:hypothetical protein
VLRRRRAREQPDQPAERADHCDIRFDLGGACRAFDCNDSLRIAGMTLDIRSGIAP